MGVQVAVTLDDMLKPKYTVSTVLAPAFAVAAGELVVWIGNAHGGSKHFEVTGLRKCLEAIRRGGSETPSSGLHSYGKVVAPGLQSDVSTGFDVADLTLLTGTVTVVINTKAVTGVGTTFLTDLSVGGVIRIGTQYCTIDAITSDLALTITVVHAAGAAAADYYKVTNTPLTGSMTVTAGTDAVLGVDTLFTTELVAGTSVLLLEGEYIGVTTVTDALNIVLAANHVGGAAVTALTGTVSVTIATNAVIGVATEFTTELVAGTSIIEIDGEYFTVLGITSDLALTLSAVHSAGASGATANLQPLGQLATPVLFTGTVSVTAGQTAVTGVGTTFLADLSVGDVIKIGTQLLAVASIATNTALVLAAAHTAGASGADYYVSNTPAELDVGIWYGDLFQPLPGSTLTPHVLRSIEKYLETTQKAA
jgi:hypothetical protein